MLLHQPAPGCGERAEYARTPSFLVHDGVGRVLVHVLPELGTALASNMSVYW